MRGFDAMNPRKLPVTPNYLSFNLRFCCAKWQQCLLKDYPAKGKEFFKLIHDFFEMVSKLAALRRVPHHKKRRVFDMVLAA